MSPSWLTIIFKRPSILLSALELKNKRAILCRWVSIFSAKEKMISWLCLPHNATFEQILEVTERRFPQDYAKWVRLKFSCGLKHSSSEMYELTPRRIRLAVRTICPRERKKLPVATVWQLLDFVLNRHLRFWVHDEGMHSQFWSFCYWWKAGALDSALPLHRVCKQIWDPE